MIKCSHMVVDGVDFPKNTGHEQAPTMLTGVIHVNPALVATNILSQIIMK